jgi:hypothetical protein
VSYLKAPLTCPKHKLFKGLDHFSRPMLTPHVHIH